MDSIEISDDFISTQYTVHCSQEHHVASVFGVQKLMAMILGTAQSFVILWSRCWQPVPEGKIRLCYAAHVAAPLAAPDALWGDSNTELLCVDVCTWIERFLLLK